MQLALFFCQCSFSRGSDWITNGRMVKSKYTVCLPENGWIDQEYLFYWLKDLFLKHISPERRHARNGWPLLPLHAWGPTWCSSRGVIVFCIPPNTTHVTQPLDVNIFGALKRHWSSVCHTYLTNNPGSVVTKLQFNSLFSQAWYKSIQPETIVSGFRKTGICPLN